MRCSKPVISTYLFFALITFIISSLNLSYCVNTQCPQIEKHALLSFKQSLDDPFDLQSSWNSKVDCCQWNGVVCNNLTGHVYELHLGKDDLSSGLSGKINDSLLILKHLRYLDLSGSHFEGPFPSFIGSFERLEYLNLSNAGFSGSVPRFLGNLSSLRALSLGGLDLDVDDLKWMSGLYRLERLDMSYVNLSKAGNWVQVINTFFALVELRLKDCSLNFIDNLTYVNTTKLGYLDLSDNNFNSTIPDWIYSCQYLKHIDMSDSFLHGVVSNAIANLTSLDVLDLSWNNLNGRIPTEVTKLCRLRTLDMYKNYLSGDLSVLSQNTSDCFLGSLQSLNLRDNQLSGHLPNQLGKFRSLTKLDLGKNSISGSIPFNIGDLTSLVTISLGSNKLTGNLPKSIGQLCNLDYLFIEDNMLEGVVTEDHFANLTKLAYLGASRNLLTLQVNQNWIPPFKLGTLRLESWNLGGEIPLWLETQRDYLMELDLSNTQISGNIPSWLWKTDSLTLSHNQLEGEIQYISGTYIYLDSNKFSGSIPRVADVVAELDLSNNSFAGGMAHFFCDKTNETYGLEILHLSGNQLTGELPDCFIKWPSLKVLNLGNNIMSGKIPKSIGHLNLLMSLNLYSNGFSGEIPSSMKNCTQLMKINLFNNNFSGNIPAWIGTSLSELRILILKSNVFGGEIPSDLCHLTSLQILDLSSNNISRAIPNCINNFTAMATKRSSIYDVTSPYVASSSYIGTLTEGTFVSTKGRELMYDTTLTLVTNIDLSSNNLSGNIPQELTSLVELKSLNLSHNQLSGSIPDRIGEMNQLESLDMSRNSLSGEIPNSFMLLSFLSYLNLSYNNLSGVIPQSTQIKGMNASSFIGNKLCGPPLTESCNDDSPIPTRTGEVEDKDEEFDSWFYVFLSSGFAVGLFTFSAVLIINREWRESYFGLLEDMWKMVCVYISISTRKIRR